MKLESEPKPDKRYMGTSKNVDGYFTIDLFTALQILC